jgi:hypothetical protein
MGKNESLTIAFTLVCLETKPNFSSPKKAFLAFL